MKLKLIIASVVGLLATVITALGFNVMNSTNENKNNKKEK